MSVQEWLQLLKQELLQTSLPEWLVLVFGVAEVLLARANKIWLYPTGIIAVLLSVYVLYMAGLYAESLLNGYYLVMSIYGWWYWIKKKNQPAVKVSYSSRRDWIIVIGITFGGFGLLTLLLKNFTDSTVPVWDAWASASAWAGMWLLAKRKVENWILLNISNAFAVPLFFYKELPLYAILTIFLFMVAVQGFFKWNKIARNENSPVPFPAYQ